MTEDRNVQVSPLFRRRKTESGFDDSWISRGVRGVAVWPTGGLGDLGPGGFGQATSPPKLLGNLPPSTYLLLYLPLWYILGYYWYGLAAGRWEALHKQKRS